MNTLPLEEGDIKALPFLGECSDLNIRSKLSCYIYLKAEKFLFAADFNNLDFSLYEHIFDYIGSIDMLFLGIEREGNPLSWLYGTLLPGPLKRNYDRNRTVSGTLKKQ